MKKNIGIFVSCITLFLAMSFSPGTAVAASGEDYTSQEARIELYNQLCDSDNPEEFFSNLSPAAQETIIEMMKPSKTVEKVIDLSDKGTTAICLLAEVYSSDGIHLYDYSQTITWTWDGSTVTGIVNWYDTATIYALFIYFDGSETSSSGGAGYTYFWGQHEGMFYYQIYLIKIWEHYTTISMFAYYDGSYSY